VDATAQTPVLRSIQPEYRPRQPGLFRKLFRQRFPAFQALCRTGGDKIAYHFESDGEKNVIDSVAWLRTQIAK
jgi:hypothetical protein